MKVVPAIVIAVAVLSISAPAYAQVYVVQQQSQAYSPLTGAGVVTATLTARSPLSFSADDEGYLDLPLGFNFPLYGTNFSTVTIDSNGFLMFTNGNPTDCRTGFTCYAGGKIPSSTRTPHAIIAPWWADMSGSRPTSAIRYKLGAGQLEVEWHDWHDYTSASSTPDFIYSVKVTITASGMFQVHYGTITGATGFSSISAGWEDASGTQGASFLGAAGCYNNTPINCCSSTSAACTKE